jgi:5-(carboxyamino)imidazole ribonucleotide mutase
MSMSQTPPNEPIVGIIMGSKSDWPTMRQAAEVLAALGIGHECRIVSAHRTPDLLAEYAKSARGRGLLAIVAGAGGAAHLPGMVAAHTTVPVIGVPVRSAALAGLDSLLSIAQMPAGIPVGTVPIGDARAAGVMAARIVAVARPEFEVAVRGIGAPGSNGSGSAWDAWRGMGEHDHLMEWSGWCGSRIPVPPGTGR